MVYNKLPFFSIRYKKHTHTHVYPYKTQSADKENVGFVREEFTFMVPLTSEIDRVLETERHPHTFKKKNNV